MCLVSADASLSPPLALGQVELQMYRIQHKLVSGELIKQGLPEVCKHSEYLCAVVWANVMRLCQIHTTLCYHANNRPYNKWPAHDWSHRPRENANRKKRTNTKTKLLFTFTEATMYIHEHRCALLTNMHQGNTYHSLSVWDDCCLTAVTMNFTN